MKSLLFLIQYLSNKFMSTLRLFFHNILTEISCREAIKFPSENSYKKKFESAWCLQRCSKDALSYFHNNLLIKCILYKSLLEVDIVNDIFYFVLMWHKFMQFLLFVYFFMKKGESKCIIFWIKWFKTWNN